MFTKKLKVVGGQTSQFFCELLNNNFRNSDAEKKCGWGHLLEHSRGKDITAIFPTKIKLTWESQQKTSEWTSRP